MDFKQVLEDAKRKQQAAQNIYQPTGDTSKVNPLIQKQLYETFYGIYGDEARTTDAVNRAMDYYSKTPTAYDSFGQNTSKVSDLLNSSLTNGLPHKREYMQQTLKDIGQSTNKALTRTDEHLASSGLNRSGIGAVIANDIYEGQANAISNAENDLNMQELDYRKSVISQLLGLEGMKLGALQQDHNKDMDIFNTLEGKRQYDSQSNAANEIDWGSIIGSVLGTAAQAGTKALLL